MLTVAALAAGRGVQVFVIAVTVTYTSLIGQRLAGPALATLPYTLLVLTGGLATLPVSWLLVRWGRQPVFVVGAISGAAGALVAAGAPGFVTFCLGCALIGIYHTTAFFYRYAAADADPEHAARAVALAIGGGILGALVPMGPHPFIDTALVLALFAVILAILSIPPMLAPPRGWNLSVMRHPDFLTAALIGAMAWLVMIGVMTVSPLVMVACGLSEDDAARGIQWHLVAMFAPSFATGYLQRHFGLMPILFAGCAAFVGSAVLISLRHFVVGLVLLGIGWNFLYYVSTMLLVRLPKEEQAPAQGLNEQISWIAQATAAGLAGVAFSYS